MFLTLKINIIAIGKICILKLYILLFNFILNACKNAKRPYFEPIKNLNATLKASYKTICDYIYKNTLKRKIYE